MLVELFGRATTFSQVRRGSLFRFAGGLGAADLQRMALKVSVQGQEARVLLSPGHPQWKERPAIYWGSPGSDDPAFEIPDAILRPSLRREHWKLGAREIFGIGDLVISERAFLVVGLHVEHGNLALVDLENGEVSTIPSEIAAIVSHWSVVQVVDGVPVTLLEYAPPSAKES